MPEPSHVCFPPQVALSMGEPGPPRPWALGLLLLLLPQTWGAGERRRGTGCGLQGAGHGAQGTRPGQEATPSFPSPAPRWWLLCAVLSRTVSGSHQSLLGVPVSLSPLYVPVPSQGPCPSLSSQFPFLAEVQSLRLCVPHLADRVHPHVFPSREPPVPPVPPHGSLIARHGVTCLLGVRLAGAAAVPELQQPAQGGRALWGLGLGNPGVLVLGNGDHRPEEQGEPLSGGSQSPGGKRWGGSWG